MGVDEEYTAALLHDNDSCTSYCITGCNDLVRSDTNGRSQYNTAT